jgi:hypothetical protein
MASRLITLGGRRVEGFRAGGGGGGESFRIPGWMPGVLSFPMLDAEESFGISIKTCVRLEMPIGERSASVDSDGEGVDADVNDMAEGLTNVLDCLDP